jgi:tetratricopeptide (TPR) repeat protein
MTGRSQVFLRRTLLAFVLACAGLAGGGAEVAAAPDAGAVSAGADAGAAPAAAAPSSSASGAASSSSPSTSSATTLTVPGCKGGTMTSEAAGPTLKSAAPPLPPPTPQQVAAYEAMKGEADVYAKGARDYRDTITTIITLHYEAKKKSILSGLDREIGIEQAELKKARDEAIKKHEDFIARYSGANAQPEATPDAMYKLAALYEERARDIDDQSQVPDRLKPAIALYKRVIREFPNYKELAGIYYFLGHALNDSNRKPEAQQVWRSLVCHNHYKYPVAQDPKNAEADEVLPLPQDNTEEYWKQWRGKFPRPDSLKKGGPDSKFVDPYPQDCEMVAQPGLLPGTDPKYVAEIWWQIGEWEFDQYDLGGGVVEYEPYAVYDYNRAASAYLHSMVYKKPPLFGVALYKYAWTLFKQQRYQEAVKNFVLLLNYTDEQQKLTGDPGADFRSEAYTYIAGSLTNVDFVGPGPDEPYIQRDDIVSTEMRPAVVEQKLRVAFDRVQDPKIVPQDKPWTSEIYKALSLEYRSLNEYDNSILVYNKILEKWPWDPAPRSNSDPNGAPDIQNAIAETYELKARATKVGTERTQYEGEVLKARTQLAKYIGDTEWVDKNKDNPAAIQRAEELVRTGLQSAAIQHTRNGQDAVDRAARAQGDLKTQVMELNNALSEYKLASLGWLGYLKQDEQAPDSYKSRYFYADALHQAVRIQVSLHKAVPNQFPEPAGVDIDTAKCAAIDVRDSDEDDQYLDNAAFFVVDLSDVGRDLAYAKFAETNGTQGIEPLKQPKMEGPEGDQKVVVQAIPVLIQASMLARDEYVQRVPPEKDKPIDPNDKSSPMRSAEYAFYSADQFYLYGHFKEARDRFEPMWKDHCGKDELGYEAWKRLIDMSNLEKDTERSIQLAEAEKAHSCAITAEQKGDATILVDPTIKNAAFIRARQVFTKARGMPPGPDRDAAYKQAAGMYEAALKAAPAHRDAPEAAMNSAFAYKQVGDFNKSIEMYNVFISNYGSEDNLNRLQKGGVDPDTKQKVGPQPDQYKERVKYLSDAYDALSNTYFGFFNYQQAAQSFGKIAQNDRFDDDHRQTAARNAMVLYANLGDRPSMNAAYAVLTSPKMHLPPDKKADADFLKANFEYSQWNPDAPDTGGNRQARQTAEGALQGFYNANKNNPAAARYVVEAAYKVAKMQKTAGDTGYHTWFRNTAIAWDFFNAHPLELTSADGKKTTVKATDSPYDDYAGEAAFTLVDEEIRSEFDYETGHHKYSGTVVDVKKAYDKDFNDAEQKYKPQLDKIATTYQSFTWAAASVARTGTLYDSLRTGLELVVPKYFTPQQQALLDKLRNLGQDDKANEIEDQVRGAWRTTKDAYLDAANQKMIRNYVRAAISGRKNNVKNDAVQHAVARLAFFTDYLGDPKMKGYVEATTDPSDPSKNLTYTNGMFLQWRSGLDQTPPPNGQPAPLPVAP